MKSLSKEAILLELCHLLAKTRWGLKKVRRISKPLVGSDRKGRVRSGPAFLFGECALHTLIHTLAILYQLQYLGLNLGNAESFTPFFSSQHLVPD